jgi:hypothetical protein
MTASLHLREVLAVTSSLGILLAGCSSAGGSSSRSVAAASPTPDSITRNYVALIHNYWIQEQAADEVAHGSNLAAKVCLGVDPPGTPTKLQLIDPSMCHERAVAILANAQKFLSDLDRTPAPPKFASDDQAFRTQLPKAIAALEALISAAGTGSKEAVLQSATAYNNDMYPIVTDALNDVDPSVAHA